MTTRKKTVLDVLLFVRDKRLNSVQVTDQILRNKFGKSLYSQAILSDLIARIGDYYELTPAGYALLSSTEFSETLREFKKESAIHASAVTELTLILLFLGIIGIMMSALNIIAFYQGSVDSENRTQTLIFTYVMIAVFMASILMVIYHVLGKYRKDSKSQTKNEPL